MRSSGDPLDPGLQHLLAVWMPRQRWYPAKGRGVGLVLLGAAPLQQVSGAHAGTDVEVLVVGLDSGDRLDVVQVPLTYRSEPLGGADAAEVGELDGAAGHRWVYDGPHDPAYVSALLHSLQTPPGARLPPSGTPARVLSGEQSNTSIVVGADHPDATIVKVFRTLHPGANPDVEVTAALAAGGCDRVAAVRGWSSGSWTGRSGEQVTGHLAVAVEFLGGSQDAWREAVAAAETGAPFDERARQIGAATAEVHLALADAFGRTAMSDDERQRLLDGLRSRVDWALASAPSLERYRDALRRYCDRIGDLARLPDLQRVHGDLHLGQVLHSPARGWILLDFEGEPLRPLTERTRHDLTLRDVAGMLRSFDYAARFSTVGQLDPDVVAASGRWAGAARDAFCAGYAAAGGDEPGRHAALLSALELDKALYEVVYETRNRPQWLEVPLHAVDRVLS
ncbi:MAG TPA: aminoglycoside phosphotransferase [Actinomycetales bacterium]|nr:aminoglycoside phosphotransferase [Actinomycetales bacterium]